MIGTTMPNEPATGPRNFASALIAEYSKGRAIPKFVCLETEFGWLRSAVVQQNWRLAYKKFPRCAGINKKNRYMRRN